MKKKLLLIAPFTKSHGQGVVSLIVEKILSEEKTHQIVINTHKSNVFFIKFIYNIFLIFKISYTAFVKKPNIFYFTPSRSFLGSIRDLNVLLIKKYFLKSLRLVGHLHGSDLKCFLNQNLYGKFLEQLYIDLLDILIINSNSHKKYALGNNFNNYRIINNPITNNIPIENKNKIKQTIKFLHVSNPIAEKGLLEGINWVEKHCPVPWKFFIVGWNKNEFCNVYKNSSFNTKKIIDDDRVAFLGKLFGEDYKSIFLKANVFIFPSFYPIEAQPLVLIDSIMFNHVVIISHFKMLKDFKIFPSVKFIEKTKNWNEISILLKNKSLLEKSRDLAIKKFDVVKFKKKLINTIFKEN